MKKLVYLLFAIATIYSPVASDAQTYGNEWIDYSRTYYKIKVGGEGIYRISKPTLDAAGLSSVPGSQFVLYRDGQQEPIYVSTAGTMGSSDYIEFYGRKADGQLDKQLYLQPQYQPNERISLFSDTAVYFLSYSAQPPYERLTQAPNNIPSNPPAPLAYGLYTAGVDFLRNFCGGRNVYGSYHIPLSRFDNAEGYVDTLVGIHIPLQYTVPTPNAITNGPAAMARTSIIRYGYQSNPSPATIKLNNQQLASATLHRDFTTHVNFNIPSSSLGNTTTLNYAATNVGGTYDVYGVSFIEIRYARNFDYTGQNLMSYDLSASSSSQYLEFTGFSSSVPPKLYDLTNKKWYVGDLSVSGKARFYLEPSFSNRKIVIYTENSNAVRQVQQLPARQFTDYTQALNQGDYIILTHKNYEAPHNGRNFIHEYRNYRASAAGGSHQVMVAEVTELYDQFAYGQDIHPLSIRRFLQFAYDKWTTVPPKSVFIIGKGLLYHKYRKYQQSILAYPYSAIVPTYGDVGADLNFVNFLSQQQQAMNIGRLSAWNPSEIAVYLDKIKAYEAALAGSAFPTHETEFWKRQVLHIVGGQHVAEQNGLAATMTAAAGIITDTSFSGEVTTVRKNTTNPIDQIHNKSIDSLVNNGVSIIAFHGHATPNGFELNLNNPETYHSSPKMPHFIALGCDVAQVFTPSNVLRTVSERFLIAPLGGSVSMIASNTLQFADFHAEYLPELYNSISRENFGATIGDHHRHVYNKMILAKPGNEFYYFHLESMILQGDPASPVFGPQKPDYHVSADRISSIPVNVSASADSFTLKVVAFNLGKGIRDTVQIKIEHINPKGSVAVLHNRNVYALLNTDTLYFNIPVNNQVDIGLNKYKVTIDADSRWDELSETNNTASLDMFIYSDHLIPVYPKEFSIVTEPGVTLKASTLNPFRSTGRYRIEVDTTELFNSPLKQQTLVTSPGGVIKWTPAITMRDSTVYYWRTAYDSMSNGTYQWTTSSFIYLAQGSPGWNQSHYFQYKKDGFNGLTLNSDRAFRFSTGNNTVSVFQAVFSENGATPWNTADFVKVMFNNSDIQRLGCWPWDGTIQIMVFDSASTAPWKNDSLNGTGGAYPVCNTTRNKYAFEFPVWEPNGRNNARRFLDSIPAGHYVLVRNIINLGKYTDAFANDWKADTTINGSGVSLYHSLYNMGFTQLDSFNSRKPFIFFRKKGSNAYPVHQVVGTSMQDTLQRHFLLPSYRRSGELHSTVVGPSMEWKQLKWEHSALDNNPQNDKPFVQIYGIDTNSNSQLVYTGYTQDTSLAFIDAKQFPNILLIWTSYDSTDLSSAQLDYWRVLYSPVPEAALNPAAHFTFEDSLHVGQEAELALTIENLSKLPMDSMLVRYKVIDENGVTHLVGNRRYRPLPGEDTLIATLNFDPAAYPGNNVLFIEANPDWDQPEQYHPNNLGYLPFRIITDRHNPLIDVTFDGVHILDRDIVSAKPFIKITLKDENKFLALDDSSLVLLRIRYPDVNQTTQPEVVPFDGTIAKFIPAKPGEKNEAVIEYRPTFTQDGIYELLVNGRDKSGNAVASTDYQISFEVVNKSTITNILNYPNPFSTSTAFVFTLTGSQIPSQFKIQIMTVTGKVVREITKAELGPIHVGRNITEYKWDGRDQYGQLLGNGVYLYRVVTSINGSDVEKRQSAADRFYKNGYGKMYIMR